MDYTFMVFIVLLLGGYATSEDPGMKLRLTKKGIDYVNTIFKVTIAEVLQEQHLDTLKEDDEKLNYRLSNFRTGNVILQKSNISLNQELREITMAVYDATMDVTVDYEANYTVLFLMPISNSGSVTAHFKQVSITLNIGLGQNNDSTLQPVTRSCSADIGSFDLTFHGDYAWLLNLLKGLFQGKIRNSLKEMVCPFLQMKIDNDKSLSQMRSQADFFDTFIIDYRILTPVVITNDYIEANLKGQVYWKSDRSEPPFSPTSMSEWNENDYMIYLAVSEFTARSLAYVAYTHDLLKFSISADKIQDNNFNILNTTCLNSVCMGTIIQQLTEKYPDSKVAFKVSTSQVPAIMSSPGGVDVTFFGEVDMAVERSNDSTVSVVTANLTVSANVSISIQGDRVVANILNWSTTIESYSSIDSLELGFVTQAVDRSLALLIVPAINAVANKGIPLPTIPNLTLVNPTVIYDEGQLVIGADVKYRSYI